MTKSPSDAARPLPTWLVVVGSIVIVAHLGALIVVVLSHPSGPWPGQGPEPGPQFALKLNSAAASNYLKLLNFPFPQHRPDALPAIRFEVELKDELGKTITKVTYPDKNVNSWVYHRQAILAFGLGLDDQLPVSTEEVGRGKVQTIKSFQPAKAPRSFEYVEVPRKAGTTYVFPSEFSLQLADSYARYLCRLHGASSAELIRYRGESIPPSVLSTESPPPTEEFKRTHIFGKLPRR